MDILFLSVSTGGGHLKAAEAIKDAVEDRFPEARTMIVDALNYISPTVDKLIVGGYLGLLKKTPGVYGKLYELSEAGDSIHDICFAANSLFALKLRKLIDDFMPSVIVCTHTFPFHMLSSLKRRGKVDIPVAAVVTDYASHPFWEHNNINALIVPHELVKKEMIMRGMPAEMIYPYGIPIDKCFLERKDKAELFKEFDLDDKFTVLVMGGSLGFGKLDLVFESLLKSRYDIQIIAVTGYNTKLKNHLERDYFNKDKKIRIFSYTDRISDLMDIADLIITKPGGMTIAEALVKGLPMLILSAIPGQEERNANFLVSNGAAIKMSDFKDIDESFHHIFSNQSCMEQMKKAAQKLARPNSAENIASLLKKLSSGNIRVQAKSNYQ